MRIIFAGTPDFAATCLAALLTSQHEIVAVYSQPDRPAGRGRKLTASPVKQLALEHNIPIEQPLNFKDPADRQRLLDYQADVMVVVAYGLILPQAVLDTPKYGCLNIHASLLPRWRGAAPIQRSILAGDQETGVCIMQMAAGLDTGPVLSRSIVPIDTTDTAQSLHDKLAESGAKTLLTTLDDLLALQPKAEPQDDNQSCYAEKLQKAEAIIDWQQTAEEIDRRVRAFNPWPVTQTLWRGETLRIWTATLVDEQSKGEAGEIVKVDRDGLLVATGQGTLKITQLQLPGKRSMSVTDLLNSQSIEVGEKLG
ncbi:methionyl-tRNA formyltransferase [Methylophaga sp. OBS3]|uniref:methionyl-tRNA formyltransferase n=1 Tax=Methylophaga sp. OBS3 TaxID=2991934 RepID=UPI00225016E6|nr:methionyl-tRNA formyltransferase [Methylophaga sp. OBS3]MCX4189796.1 methionyl-tRNA formyltransferase [Methylophaga sp. OBS3]